MGGVRRAIVIQLILVVGFVLAGESGSQALPLPQPRESARPLCISQLALANQACASIPFRTVTRSAISEVGDDPAPGPRAAIDQLYHSSHGHNRHHHRHDREDREEQDHKSGSHQDHEHRRHHKSKRSNADHKHKHNHNGHHHHHGGHHKSKVGHHHGTEECCRWLRAMDDRCVCTLLLRLPAFLSGPAHGYTVSVDDDCEVEFECPGRFMQS